MVRSHGQLTGVLIALALGALVTLVLAQLWSQESIRRTHATDAAITRADLDGVTLFLTTLLVPARTLTVIPEAALRAELGGGVTVLSEGLRLEHPGMTIHFYLGRSRVQPDAALWVHREQFGDISHQSLMPVDGALSIQRPDPETLCLQTSDPIWIGCHTLLPGQS